MAALQGFDVLAASEAISAPPTLGQLIAGVHVPAGYAVGGLDLTVGALDPGGTMTLSVGDPDDTDRLLPADAVGQDGGTVESRPASHTWHRYAADTTVSVRCAAAPAAVVASGSIVLTLYTYPAAELETVHYTVLEELGVLREGGTPRAADLVQAVRAVREEYDTLRGLGLGRRQDLAWPPGLIPTWAVRPVAVRAAARLLGIYGIPLQRRQVILAMASQGERDLRRQCRTPTTYEPVKAVMY